VYQVQDIFSMKFFAAMKDANCCLYAALLLF